MAEHVFQSRVSWPGGRNSQGQLHSGAIRQVISIPAAMDGPGTGTNPDEMLLGAAATCYIITLAAMLERAGVQVEQMDMDSTAVVEVKGGVFTFRRIRHQPRIRLAAGQPDEALAKLDRLVSAAGRNCMISRALQGNVEISVDSSHLLAEPAASG